MDNDVDKPVRGGGLWVSRAVNPEKYLKFAHEMRTICDKTDRI